MYWELWDVGSRNLIEDFASEEEALQAVREILAPNRPELIDDLALVAMYEEGESRDAELPPALQGAELQARLNEDQLVIAAASSRTVHDKIRKWLAEENWTTTDIENRYAIFNVNVKLLDGQGVRIFQHRAHRDQIRIAASLELGISIQAELSQNQSKSPPDILWNIYRDATLAGVDIEGVDPPLDVIWHSTNVHFDGLTKDVLMQRILLVLRVLRLSARSLIRELEGAGHPDVADTLRDFDREEAGWSIGILTRAS
jgi:hypothetical protein